MSQDTSEGSAFADRSPAERQLYLKTMVVEYRGLNDVLRKIDAWHLPVKDGLPASGSCHALLGQHRAGKSFALKRYRNRFPSRLDEQAQARITPVLYVETAAQSNPKDLATALYDALSDGPTAIDNRLSGPSQLTKFLLELKFHGVELIIFDDAQNLIVDNRSSKLFKDFICRILNQNCCGVILAGKPSVYDAVESYPPLEGRGSLPNFTIPALRWSVARERKDFIHFCKELDRRLPFRKASLLGDQKIALHLFYASRGLIGRLCNYVHDAAHIAINEQSDSIKIEHLRSAAIDRLRPGADFVPFEHEITPTMIEHIEGA